MRTASDVYHRLLYDEGLDLHDDAIIGYLDRFRGCMEVMLAKFEAGGEIPQHRILYFRVGSEFLWHKETRLDLVFQSTDMDAALSLAKVSLRAVDLEQAQSNRIEDEEARRLKAWIPRQSRPVIASFSDLSRVSVHRVSAVSGSWIALDSLAARRSLDEAFSFSSGTDTPSCSSSNGAPESEASLLSVRTLNVLHDAYLSTSVKSLTPSRWQAIADAIACNSATFYVLTEATRAFANFLLADARVKKMYSSTDGPLSGFQTLPPASAATGQLVLIRRDVEVKSVYFTTTSKSTGKRLVFVVAILPCGTSMALAAVHLTSGQIGSSESAPAVAKRRQQLEFVLKRLSSLTVDVDTTCALQVVAGDFNFHDADDDACRGLLQGFVEASSEMHCPTYDPTRNSLAAMNSCREEGVRLDRIYVKDATKNMSCAESSVSVLNHKLFLTEPISTERPLLFDQELRALLPIGLFPSDHFGVSTLFALGGAPRPNHGKSNWSMSTALAIIPETYSLGEIDAWLRKEHDPAHRKWMPHVNLLYPFVAADLVEQFICDFRDYRLLGGPTMPNRVDLKFKGVSSFKHKTTSTVFLEGEGNDGLQEIRALAKNVAERVAGGPATQGRSQAAGGWVPHMTLAKLNNQKSDVPAFVQKAQDEFLMKKGRWDRPTSSLAILQKIGSRMEVVEMVKLGSSYGRSSRTKKTLQLTKALARQVFYGRRDFQLTPVGSAAITKGKGSSQTSDVDVVLVPPPKYSQMTPKEFAASAQQVLSEGPDGGCTIRIAGDANCPIVAIDLAKSHQLLPVDILFGNTYFSEQAIADGEAITAQVEHLVNTTSLTSETFADTLLEVKGWAKGKMLTQRGYTLFAGVAWSILLVAATTLASKDDFDALGDVQSLLIYFFHIYSTFDFRTTAITVAGPIPRSSLGASDAGDGAKDGSVVLTPVSHTNANRGVSRAVTHEVQKEMKTALAALQCGIPQWHSYSRMEIEELESRYDSLVVVSIAVSDEFCVPLVEGWLRGRFAHFANQELGERGIAVRPSAKLRITRLEAHSRVSCVMYCGVCEEWCTAPMSARNGLVSHAAGTLNDRFLRWDQRPASSSLRVGLVSQGTMPNRFGPGSLQQEPEAFEW